MYIQAETPADLGKYLRDVRESQGLDLHTVARHLHIRPKYLHSLEHGELSELPGAPYIKGYVLNYAGYLGLDRQHILNIFEQVSGQRAKHVYYVPEPNRKENAPGPGVLALGVLIIALGYGLWYGVLRDDALEESNIAAVPEAMLYNLYYRPVDLTGNDCFGYKVRYYPPCYGEVTEQLPDSMLVAEMKTWPEIKDWPAYFARLKKEREERAAREAARVRAEQEQQLQLQQVQPVNTQQQKPIVIQEQIVKPNESSAPKIP